MFMIAFSCSVTLFFYTTQPDSLPWTYLLIYSVPLPWPGSSLCRVLCPDPPWWPRPLLGDLITLTSTFWILFCLFIFPVGTKYSQDVWTLMKRKWVFSCLILTQTTRKNRNGRNILLSRKRGDLENQWLECVRFWSGVSNSTAGLAGALLGVSGPCVLYWNLKMGTCVLLGVSLANADQCQFCLRDHRVCIWQALSLCLWFACWCTGYFVLLCHVLHSSTLISRHFQACRPGHTTARPAQSLSWVEEGNWHLRQHTEPLFTDRKETSTEI